MGLVASIVATLFGRAQASCAGRSIDIDDDAFQRAYTALFSNPRSAVAVGQRYLALHPVEADVEHLKASLFDGADATHQAVLRARLAEGRRNDFASGTTIIVDGWVLARTELRACALLTLLPQGVT